MPYAWLANPKQSTIFVIVLMIVATLFGAISSATSGDVSFTTALLIGAPITCFFGVGLYKQLQKYSTRAFIHWCGRMGFAAYDTGNVAGQMLISHLQSETNKKWMRIFHEFPEQKGPYAEGEYQGRKIWFYNLNAAAETIIAKERYDIFFCVEIESALLLEHISVSRKGMQMKDTHTVESVQVEKMFDITARPGFDALQLLDPRMLELLASYRVTAAEFGGNSIVLFYKRFPITHFVLDQCLTEAIEVVKQAERNYPTAKHAQRPL